MVYYRLFVARWSHAQDRHRFLIMLHLQFKCLINRCGNPSLSTRAKKKIKHETHEKQHTHLCAKEVWKTNQENRNKMQVIIGPTRVARLRHSSS